MSRINAKLFNPIAQTTIKIVSGRVLSAIEQSYLLTAKVLNTHQEIFYTSSYQLINYWNVLRQHLLSTTPVLCNTSNKHHVYTFE